MQDKEITSSDNQVPGLSLRTERLVAQIEHHLLHADEPSFERLTQKMMALPQLYRKQVVEIIAERMINIMQLHYLLDIVATFSQNATKEGIDEKEVVDTLTDKDVLADTQKLLSLNKHLAVHSIDDLFRIKQITQGLRSLSNVTTAYDAQRWIHQLTNIYTDKLKYEHLVDNLTDADNKSANNV
jgi:hypothetical protein